MEQVSSILVPIVTFCHVSGNVLSLIPIRTKKVKTSSGARNRRRNTPGKHRRLYVQDGEWVEEDHLLVRQLGLQFYPGENVGHFLSSTPLETRS